MDIERLRALENDLREESRKDTAHGANKEWAEWLRERYMASASAKWDAAQRIATLIAELGQEVGAVAVPMKVFSAGNWVYEETGQRFTSDELDDAAFVYYRTSPAHTSEARDAELWRFCNGTHELENGEVAKMHVNVGVNVWRGENWLAYHECSPDEAREVINGIAAMRQEGGE